MKKFRKGQMVIDIQSGKIYAVFSQSHDHKEYYFVVGQNSGFNYINEKYLEKYPGNEKIKLPKIGKGRMITVTNSTNVFFGKGNFCISKRCGDYIHFKAYDRVYMLNLCFIWPVT